MKVFIRENWKIGGYKKTYLEETGESYFAADVINEENHYFCNFHIGNKTTDLILWCESFESIKDMLIGKESKTGKFRSKIKDNTLHLEVFSDQVTIRVEILNRVELLKAVEEVESVIKIDQTF